MNITFYGAAHEVTGSCHVIDTGKKKIMLDCGMFQGGDFNEGRNADHFAFDAKNIDAVLVSHAHTDHSGRIPKLIKEGYTGPIYMTRATVELSRLIWDDAYNIMKYNNKKYQSPILFTPEEIDMAAQRCEGVDYEKKVDLGDGDFAIFRDAGHIFGSAFIELTIEGKHIVFSGDLGNEGLPIVRDTETMGEVDVLLCEATYGDRIHESPEERKETLRKLIVEGIDRGGTIMVPTFSIERTQELLYLLDELSEGDHSLPNIPIYLDSPMAIDAIPVYRKYKEYYDGEASEKFKKGNDFLDFPQLTITRTKEESKHINSNRLPKMIIAGAGMMNGGRIIHHLFRYLSDPASTLIITGYQAVGTLGREIRDGAKIVSIFGEHIPVRCHVTTITSMSGHADQNKLIEWISSAKSKPKKVYCVHGEGGAAEALAERITKELGIPAFVPHAEETITVDEITSQVAA